MSRDANPPQPLRPPRTRHRPAAVVIVIVLAATGLTGSVAEAALLVSVALLGVVSLSMLPA